AGAGGRPRGGRGGVRGRRRGHRERHARRAAGPAAVHAHAVHGARAPPQRGPLPQRVRRHDLVVGPHRGAARRARHRRRHQPQRQPVRPLAVLRARARPQDVRCRGGEVASLPAALLQGLGRAGAERRRARLHQRQPAISRSHPLRAADLPARPERHVPAQGAGVPAAGAPCRWEGGGVTENTDGDGATDVDDVTDVKRVPDWTIREIHAVGLYGATPEGGWDAELTPDDCVHTLVAVVTEEGPVGYGSAFTNDGLVKAALAVLEPLYRGERALEPERVSEKLHQNTFWMGRGGSITHAISAIDIALWDLLGQATQQSVGRLL